MPSILAMAGNGSSTLYKPASISALATKKLVIMESFGSPMESSSEIVLLVVLLKIYFYQYDATNCPYRERSPTRHVSYTGIF